MRYVSCLRLTFSALLALYAAEGLAVTAATLKGQKDKDSVMTVTTSAANRAESDIQIRRIKGLLAEAEITSDTFFTQVENMRKKLGQ